MRSVANWKLITAYIFSMKVRWIYSGCRCISSVFRCISSVFRCISSVFRCISAVFRWIYSGCQWIISAFRWLSSVFRCISSVFRWIGSGCQWISSVFRCISAVFRWINLRASIILSFASGLLKSLLQFKIFFLKAIAPNPNPPHRGLVRPYMHSLRLDSRTVWHWVFI